MAAQGRGSFSDLKMDLLEKGHAFSFFQVIRLLRRLCTLRTDTPGAPPDGAADLRIRPNLSLAFPAADVDRVEETAGDQEDRRFTVTANLLGLYGSSSPLPTFYTEDLMDEADNEESVARDFIDIFNHRLYLLLFEAWAKYRLCLQVVEQGSHDHLLRLFALLGLGEKAFREDIPEPHHLIRYVGLLAQFPRSAAGLECLLGDALGGVSVSVLPCVERKAAIPPDQRLFLGRSGGSLGADSYIGEEVADRMGKFRIQVAGVHREQFHALLPGGRRSAKLAFLTELFVPDPLEYDVELILAAGEAQPACLGRPEWSRLGLDTWVFSRQTMGEVSLRYG